MSARPDYKALGKRGGLRTASTRDMREVAANARKKAPSSLDYWRAKVIEEFGVLDASDRDRRATAAMRLYFSRIARRRRSNAKKAGDDEPASSFDHGCSRDLLGD
jgi:hypothetical protein